MPCKDATKYARVNAVISSIEDGTNWDVAESPEKLYFYQIRAAQNMDIFEPYSEEQTTLMTYLTDRMAGRRLCDYAWRIYAQST